MIQFYSIIKCQWIAASRCHGPLSTPGTCALSLSSRTILSYAQRLHRHPTSDNNTKLRHCYETGYKLTLFHNLHRSFPFSQHETTTNNTSAQRPSSHPHRTIFSPPRNELQSTPLPHTRSVSPQQATLVIFQRTNTFMTRLHAKQNQHTQNGFPRHFPQRLQGILRMHSSEIMVRLHPPGQG